MRDPMICFGLSAEQQGTMKEFAANPQNEGVNVIVTTDSRVLDHTLRLARANDYTHVVLYLGEDYANPNGSRTPRVIRSLLEGFIPRKVPLTVGVVPRYGSEFTDARKLPDDMRYVVTENPLAMLTHPF